MKSFLGIPLSRLDYMAGRFSSNRADYYEYLADLIRDVGGRRTLRRIFDEDAQRYRGMLNARGFLSGHWAKQFDECGGELSLVFKGSLPADEIALIAQGQAAGAGALEQAFRDVAALTRLMSTLRWTFVSTIAMGAIGIGLILTMLIVIIPYVTVPALAETFTGIPDEFLGPSSKSLMDFGRAMSGHVVTVVAAIAVVIYGSSWSLRHYVGPGRAQLDKWLLWRIYRDFEGVKFLASLAAMVKKRGNTAIRLRDAIAMQLEGASAWKRSHVIKMLDKIDCGVVGPETFDTGIVDRNALWTLSDLMSTLGVDEGLQKTRHHIESRLIKQLSRKATIARWVMLILSVVAMLAIYLWHMAAIYEIQASFSAVAQ